MAALRRLRSRHSRRFAGRTTRRYGYWADEGTIAGILVDQRGESTINACRQPEAAPWSSTPQDQNATSSIEFLANWVIDSQFSSPISLRQLHSSPARVSLSLASPPHPSKCTHPPPAEPDRRVRPSSCLCCLRQSATPLSFRRRPSTTW